MRTKTRILLFLGLFSLPIAHGGQVPDHGEGFLIGFAKSDFVTERREAGDGKAGPIDKVALHGLCWFPQKESSDGMYFMGHGDLSTNGKFTEFVDALRKE